ncbi:MAG: type II secretion system GspH family protein [Oscillospiraceae bacterium]|nr:type II secretion system GspH family protein [Oscillospiraceae bacterium]
MIIKHLQSLRNKPGFTLVELVVVIAIIGVLATVTIPVSASFVRRGQQTNRANIARNIFVLMQNHLMKAQTDRVLKTTLSGHYFELSPSGRYTDDILPAMEDVNRVDLELAANGGLFPAAEATLGNAENIRFISKPRDYVLGNGTAEQDLFFEMLSELILDSEILREAIFMEYNIMTGAVLSIFYGNANQDEFTYMAADDDNINNITGERGDAYVGTAMVRRQGYYGVSETGVLPPVVGISTDKANITDGAAPGGALEASSTYGLTDPRFKRNVLYAEFIIESSDASGYTFELLSASAPNDPAILEAPPLGAATNFYDALSASQRIYIDADRPVNDTEVGTMTAGSGEGASFSRVIWVIDYFGEDENENGTKIGGATDPAITGRPATNVRVRATRGDGVSVTSLTVANTLFARELTPGNFEITSARHLNNVRYALVQGAWVCTCGLDCDPGCDFTNDNISFRQTVDIDMMANFNKINDFEPLGVLKGTYRALSVSDELGNSQFAAINNLKMSAGISNAGLFNENQGAIDGLTLNDALISAEGGGAFAGVNNGTLSRVILKDSTLNMGAESAGGLTGLNDASGFIKDSMVISSTINGSGITGGIAGENRAVSVPGYTLGIQRSGVEFSSVAGYGNSVGGFVGNNAGDIVDVYFLSVNRTTEPSPVSSGGGGIAGLNSGLVQRAFYIAPAPRIDCPGYDCYNVTNCEYHLFPITRSGNESVDSFYLAGRNYSIGTWTGGMNYNSSINSEYTIEGFDDVDKHRLTTEFFNKTWIENTANVRFTNWKDGSGLPDGHPYPVIRTLPEPNNRPLAGGRRLIERPELGTPLSNLIFELDFINGDFNAPHRNPITGALANFNNTGVQTNTGATHNTVWNRTDTGHIDGNANSFWIYYNPDFVQGWNIRPRDQVNYGRWTTTIHTELNPFPGVATVVSPNFILNDGWRGTGANRFWVWRTFEYQRPTTKRHETGSGPTLNTNPTTGRMDEGRAARGYNGSMTEAYAELNPDIQSTIYQRCETERYPFFARGQQFYYTYHHLTRQRASVDQVILSPPSGRPADNMSFYLTNNPETVFQSDGRNHAGFSALTLIRPSASPRSQPPAGTDPNNRDSLWYNPMAARTVAYSDRYFVEGVGTITFNSALQTYWDQNGSNVRGGISYPNHWTDSNRSPFFGASWTQPIFIHDVWIGTSGITGTAGTPAVPGADIQWTVADSSGTILETRVGTDNHVLRLPIGTQLASVPITGGAATLKIDYRTGQNTGSTRRFVVWTDLSAGATETFGYPEDSRRTANQAVRSGNLQNDANTSSNITIPRNLLINASGQRAQFIYIILTTQGSGTNADILPNNQRGGDGGSGNNEFSRLGRVTLTVPGTAASGETVSVPNSTAIRSGYGVTFWTQNALGLNPGGYSDIASLATATGLNAAQLQQRIFGFWDVAYGWKQYYGQYTVPDGQVQTEFAFQSNSGDAQQGNYLAGIDFMTAPAHLAMTTSIKKGGVKVDFVEPNEVLTIEHLIENLGQISAGTIIIEDPLDPFHELMDYIGELSITRNGTAITGATTQEPDASNNYTLRIELPHSLLLDAKDGDVIDNILVSYNVRVRETLRSEDDTSTWLYNIQSQGTVGYSDSYKEYNYSGPDKWNFSPVEEVSISQVQLASVVAHKDIPGSRIDGPFIVTFSIMNDGSSPTQGIITDTIPRGFTVSNIRRGTATVPFSRSVYGAGASRVEQIVIHNVNLQPESSVTYSYELTSTASNYGKFGVEFASDARYVYGSAIGRANAGFPQQTIGLSIKANDLQFNNASSSNNAFNIMERNGLANLGEIVLQRDSYVVQPPEVILLNSASASDVVESVQDGLITIFGPNFRISLVGDQIVINNATGNFSTTIYYMLASTATKTNEPSFVLDSEPKSITINYTH